MVKSKRKWVIFLLLLSTLVILGVCILKNGHIKRYYISQDKYFFIYQIKSLNLIGLKHGKLFKVLNINNKKIINSSILNENEKYFCIIRNKMIEIYDFLGNRQYIYDYLDKNIITGCVSDINIDGKPEILIILGKGQIYGDELIIYSYSNILEEISRHSLLGLNPWKVLTCDVDGDGVREISIGVYKTSKFHPVMAKRPFIYSYNGKNLSPKWLGSRLSRPFDDYIFVDLDKDNMDEIVSIEVLKDNKKALNSYKWKGFGFEAIGESEEYIDISDLSCCKVDNIISARVKENNTWKKKNFILKADKLIPIKPNK